MCSQELGRDGGDMGEALQKWLSEFLELRASDRQSKLEPFQVLPTMCPQAFCL